VQLPSPWKQQAAQAEQPNAMADPLACTTPETSMAEDREVFVAPIFAQTPEQPQPFSIKAACSST